MKRILILAMALAMLLTALAGCGGDMSEVEGSISTPAAGESGGSKTPVKQTEPPDRQTEPPDEGKEIDFGEISGGEEYTNDFAGITFMLPEGWFFATEQELAEMMNLGSDIIFGEDAKALAEYAMESTVYDMMAYSASGGENIMVMFENTSRYLQGLLMSEEDYIDALKANLEMVQELTYVFEGQSDITLGGTDYKCLSASIEGYALYQDYVLRREGIYMICIVFTGAEPNPAAVFGECFS